MKVLLLDVPVLYVELFDVELLLFELVVEFEASDEVSVLVCASLEFAVVLGFVVVDGFVVDVLGFVVVVEGLVVTCDVLA